MNPRELDNALLVGVHLFQPDHSFDSFCAMNRHNHQSHLKRDVVVVAGVFGEVRVEEHHVGQQLVVLKRRELLGEQVVHGQNDLGHVGRRKQDRAHQLVASGLVSSGFVDHHIVRHA